MYTIGQNIEVGIKSFTLLSNLLYFTKDRGIFLRNEKGNKLIYTAEENLQEIWQNFGILYVNTVHGKGILINDDDVKAYKNIDIVKILNKEIILGFSEGKAIKYNFSINEVLLEMPIRFVIWFHFQNHLFIKSKSFVDAYNINNGNFLWRFDVTEIGSHVPLAKKDVASGEVLKFAGVYQYQLIALITGRKYIALDIDTGELCWELNTVAVNKTNQQINYGLGAPTHPFLNVQKGLIYVLQGEVFYIIDLNTKIASYEWSIADLPIEEYLFIIQARLFNNQIYFTACTKENFGYGNAIGIFDIESKKIIWKYTLDLAKGDFIPNSQSQIQVNDSHLYVLDNKGTLHVFEKEK